MPRMNSGPHCHHAVEPQRIANRPGRQSLSTAPRLGNQPFVPSPPLAPVALERLRHLAQRIHSLGPRPLFELLRELDAGADVADALERYARLAPLASFIAEHDGDRLRSARLIREPRQ
jgi:hypothetical protein